jgi:hypothetical protein
LHHLHRPNERTRERQNRHDQATEIQSGLKEGRRQEKKQKVVKLKKVSVKNISTNVIAQNRKHSERNQRGTVKLAHSLFSAFDMG